MHTRKQYLVYPPDYAVGGDFAVVYSRLKAWKLARKYGRGTRVSVDTTRYHKPRTRWTSSSLQHLWTITDDPSTVKKPVT